MIYSILIVIFVSSFTLFYLDDFRLSNNKFIKTIQTLSPLCLFIIIILLYSEVNNNFSIISHLGDNNNTSGSSPLSVSTSFEISKDAAVEFNKGISNIGSNIGLAGTIGGVTTAMAKVISKSALPPVQKAGLILTSAMVGAGIHIGSTSINKGEYRTSPYNISKFGSEAPKIKNDSTGLSSFNSFSNNDIFNNHLIDNSFQNSDLFNLILAIDTISCAFLTLIIILTNMILFKFFVKDIKVELKLDKYIGNKYNSTINYYLSKIVTLNKKTSDLYIIFTLIVLIIGLGYNSYFITELLNNLDIFINIHIEASRR